MDVKALAKSKRAHSQHHSKRPHGGQQKQKQKLKAPSDGTNDAGTAKKPLGKQVKEKTHSRSQGSSALPSNWDRYEDEFDSGSEGISADSASKTQDVILPKSKGADFRHLIAEAQSQASTSLSGFPSMDDVVPGEFMDGVSSILAIRGEGMLSWIGDDNFVIDDKTNGTHEASFLSLNLHAVAESLAKVDLSKRLFIESDLLPPELCPEGSAPGSNEEPAKQQTTEDPELAQGMSEELSFKDPAADVKIAHQSTTSSCSGSQAASPVTLSKDFSTAVNYVGLESAQLANHGQNKALDLTAEANIHSTKDLRRKLPTFDAGDAEKELDMLLDSLSNSKILDSPSIRSNSSFPLSMGVTSMNLPSVSSKEPGPSKTALTTANLDGALDNLLAETSIAVNQNGSLRPLEEKFVQPSAQSSSPHSGTKSTLLDDFDSWLDTL